MCMCLGYLKLGFLYPEIIEFLISKKHLASVIEEWL